MRSAVILVRNQALLPGSTVPLLPWDAQNAYSSWQVCQKKVAKIFSHRASHQAWTVSICVLLPMFRLWHFHQSLFCLRSLKHSMPDWPHVMLQQTFPVCFSIFLCLAFLWAWEPTAVWEQPHLGLFAPHSVPNFSFFFFLWENPPGCCFQNTGLLFPGKATSGRLQTLSFQTLLAAIYTAFTYIDLCDHITYIRQHYLFFSVQCEKR